MPLYKIVLWFHLYEGVASETDPAMEYFYGYDLTGGRSGHIGIKSFFASQIQSIKDTGEKFEPRYPVELSKAGEAADNAYFSASFKGRCNPFGRAMRSTSRRIRTSGSTLVYIFQCPACNKKFRRKSMSDSKLNEHKNSYGSRCYGRTGYFVETKY